MGFDGIYPLVMTNIAIENDDVQSIHPLKMVIFHSYVWLLEGKLIIVPSCKMCCDRN